MMNEELIWNKKMIDAIDHVSKTCVGSFGYLADVLLWLSRKGSWKPLYEGVCKCSVCEAVVHVEDNENYMPAYKYCPYCGVIMEGV